MFFFFFILHQAFKASPQAYSKRAGNMYKSLNTCHMGFNYISLFGNVKYMELDSISCHNGTLMWKQFPVAVTLKYYWKRNLIYFGIT